MDYLDLPLADCVDGTDAEMLCFALDRVHRQFAWKTGGLTAEQLRRRHPPSTMTLAGLIKHMASVEASWTATSQGQTLGSPWDTADRDAYEEWDWESAVTDEPEDLYALWYDTATRSRAAWAEMSQDGGLDVIVQTQIPRSRRRLLTDLLEEYLKHTGHADMLREAVDGLRGNDPPWPEWSA